MIVLLTEHMKPGSWLPHLKPIVVFSTSFCDRPVKDYYDTRIALRLHTKLVSGWSCRCSISCPWITVICCATQQASGLLVIVGNWYQFVPSFDLVCLEITPAHIGFIDRPLLLRTALIVIFLKSGDEGGMLKDVFRETSGRLCGPPSLCRWLRK